MQEVEVSARNRKRGTATSQYKRILHQAKVRQNVWLKMMQAEFPNVHLKDLSPMSNVGNKSGGAWFCVEKEATRRAGPWSSDDYADPTAKPIQLREIKDLRPYQRFIVNTANIYEPRVVNILIDPMGGVGKSIVKSWCVFYKLSHVFTKMGSSKDMIQAVCSMISNAGTRGMIIVDCPRSSDWGWEKEKEFWDTIETVKDGLVQDYRYAAKTILFPVATLWVFTNRQPTMECLSAGRFKFWMVDWNWEMVKYNEFRIGAIEKYRREQKEKELLERAQREEKRKVERGSPPFLEKTWIWSRRK